MSETDLQVGGGYKYQWECGILLALNYFFDPVRYNTILFDLVKEFLGEVTQIILEGEDHENGVDLEDINLLNENRRILIQVKTKQSKGKLWTLADPLLLKALYRFYNSGFLSEDPKNTRFVFMSNCGFNRDLLEIADAISNDKLAECPQVEALREHLDRFVDKRGNTPIDTERYYKMLSRTALVEYLKIDTVRANIQAKLQAYGRGDWQEAHAVLFELFVDQSTRTGGGSITAKSITEKLSLLKRVDLTLHGEFDLFQPERRDLVVGVLAELLDVHPNAISIYTATPGSIVLPLGLPAHTIRLLRRAVDSNSPSLGMVKIKKVTVDPDQDQASMWGLEGERYYKVLSEWSFEEEYKGELEEQKTLREKMTLSTAHQINSELHGLLGIADQLYQTRTIQENEQINNQIAQIKDIARHTTYSVKNLMWVSIEEKPALNKQWVDDLIGLLIECAHNIQMMAGYRDVGIHVAEPQRRLPPLFIDRDLFRQAVMNLLDNAVKYADRRTQVQVSSDYDESMVHIAIQNLGIPVRTEEMERIFMRGYRSKEAMARLPTGMGIGLTIAQDIVKLNGGRLSVTSAPVKRREETHLVTFTISIPIEKQEVS